MVQMDVTPKQPYALRPNKIVSEYYARADLIEHFLPEYYHVRTFSENIQDSQILWLKHDIQDSQIAWLTK